MGVEGDAVNMDSTHPLHTDLCMNPERWEAEVVVEIMEMKEGEEQVLVQILSKSCK